MRMVSFSPFSFSVRYTWTTRSTALPRNSYGVPPLFAINDAVLDEQVMGIVKNQYAELKRNAVVLFRLIRFFSPSHSNRNVIQTV